MYAYLERYKVNQILGYLKCFPDEYRFDHIKNRSNTEYAYLKMFTYSQKKKEKPQKNDNKHSKSRKKVDYLYNFIEIKTIWLIY